MSERLEALLSRKFIVTVLTLLIASLLVGLRLISDGVYATVVIGTVGAYLGINVLQKRAE